MPRRPPYMAPSLEGIEVMRGEVPLGGIRGLLSELLKQAPRTVARVSPNFVPRSALTRRAAPTRQVYDDAGRQLGFTPSADPAYAAHVASSVSKHAPRASAAASEAYERLLRRYSTQLPRR